MLVGELALTFTLMKARSALIQAESVPILQCKRDVVGVRKRSSRGKGLYSEDVHRRRRRNQVLSRARQATRQGIDAAQVEVSRTCWNHC
jgi:hypothetical protein